MTEREKEIEAQLAALKAREEKVPYERLCATYLYIILVDAKKNGKTYRWCKIGEYNKKAISSKKNQRPDSLIEKYSQISSKRVVTAQLLKEFELPHNKEKRLNDKRLHKYLRDNRVLIPVDSNLVSGVLAEEDGVTEFFEVPTSYSVDQLIADVEKALKDLAQDERNFTVKLKTTKEITVNGVSYKEKESLPKEVRDKVNFQCEPIIPFFHGDLRRIIDENLSRRTPVKKIVVQGLLLAADPLIGRFENAEKIYVLAWQKEIDANKALYYKFKDDPLYIIIIVESDADVARFYMSECEDFDLIIGNPPYNHATHARILSVVFDNNPGALIIWLAPLNLLRGGESPIPLVRTNLKDNLTSVDFYGSNFGGKLIAVDVAIYTFNGDERTSWEEATRKYFISVGVTHIDDIRSKINSAPKINRVNKDENKYSFRKRGGGTKEECWNNLLKIFSDGVISKNAFLIKDNGGLYCTRSSFVQNGALSHDTNWQNGWYCVFNSEKECKEQMDKLNDPRYRWILKVLSPNNRDLLRRPEELPESFDACNFTEEEIKELKDYYEKKIRYE